MKKVCYQALVEQTLLTHQVFYNEESANHS